MLNLTSTSDVIRVVTGSAAQIECHASWGDWNGSGVTLGRANTPAITTATTATIVAAPGAGVQRNVKNLTITNDHPSQSCTVTVEHFDGTTASELIAFILLPGENMLYGENGDWSHRDRNGAEYPPAGLGAFNGYSVPFMKSTTTPEGVGHWYCTSKDNGFPGAWSPGAPGINGRVCTGITGADAGAIPIRDPSVGANFLTELNLAASLNHTHLFFDILWVNTGTVVTTTTEQAVAMPALPPRDVNGTTNGEGCMIGMLVRASTTNAAAIANATVTYTNSGGVAGRTATLTAVNGSQIPATAIIGTVVWFNLQAGDVGVQSIQSITLGTSLGAGSVSFFIARDIAQIGTTIPNVAAAKTMPNPGVRMFNSQTMLHCMLCGTATATFISGEVVVQEK